MSQVIEECPAVAIAKDWDEEATREFDVGVLTRTWAGGRKGRLRILSDAIEFEDWRIPCSEIDVAILTLVKGIGKGYFLRIKARGTPYQFSIQGGSHFQGDLPFPVRRETTRGFDWSWLVMRILMAAITIALVAWALQKR